jgi:hypothetical protein
MMMWQVGRERIQHCIKFVGVIVLGASWAVNAQTHIENTFRAPMDILPNMSGSFGELRPNHFHSGVDFTTNSQCGQKVYAVADGYVSRIRISATGYGKAVYITHDNGYTTLYGHLDGFTHAIDSVVVAEHYDKQSFEIDFKLGSRDLPVRGGQLIGYSGNTGGSGGPHLHFEVRETTSERAMNPLLFRNDIKDNVKPSVYGIKFYPLSDDAAIECLHQSQYKKVTGAGGVYRLENNAVIKASGSIGMGIETIDFSTGSVRKCGVYSIALFVNDTQVFKSEMESFSFDHTRYINSLVDYAYKVNSGKWVQKSFIDENNKLDIYTEKKNRGFIEIEPGETYDMRYEIQDVRGNKSLVKFTIKGGEPKENKTEKAKLLNCKTSHQVDNDELRVSVPEDCFYTDVNFIVKKLVDGQGADVWQIGERTIPVQQPISIEMKVPASLDKYKNQVALAYKNGNGKLTFAGGGYKYGWIIGKIRDLGNYTLTIDNVAPSVNWKDLPAGYNYKGRKTLELLIADNFSGIASYRCEIDGTWALFEYDAKTRRLICPLNRARIARGKKHSLHVTVSDGCGNVTKKEWSFIY